MDLNTTIEENNKERMENLKNNIDILKNAEPFDVIKIWNEDFIFHSLDFHFNEIKFYYFTSNWYQHLDFDLSDLYSKEIKKEQVINKISQFYSEIEHGIKERTEIQRQIKEKHPSLFEEN